MRVDEADGAPGGLTVHPIVERTAHGNPGIPGPTRASEVTTADCLFTIAATRPSVNSDVTQDFQLDEGVYARP
jgi:hypothetical protein